MRDWKTGPAAAETEAAESNDPQIQALLDFEPAPRMLKRKDGWTPALQRKFIARLAETGSPTLAAEALGKNRYGVEKVYKSPGAEGFREAWHQAVELFEARAAEQQERHNSAAAATRPPFADRRRTFPSPQPSPSGGEGDEEISEERKLEILESIAKKFMRKVMAEREARLSGRIVAADFYLRQITAIEIIFDLSAARLGIDPNELLRSLRRGEHGIIEIVDTPFVQFLDAQRRAYWESDPHRAAPPEDRPRGILPRPRRPPNPRRPARLRSDDPAGAGIFGGGVGEDDLRRAGAGAGKAIRRRCGGASRVGAPRARSLGRFRTRR